MLVSFLKMKSFWFLIVFCMLVSAAAGSDRTFYCKNGGCIKQVDLRNRVGSSAFACVASDGSRSKTRYPRSKNTKWRTNLLQRGWEPAEFCADEIDE